MRSVGVGCNDSWAFFRFLTMRKDLLGDILGEAGGSEVNPEDNEQTDAVFVGADEQEPYEPEADSDIDPRAFTRRGAARVEMPKEPASSALPDDSVAYVKARRVAELKFGFYKLLALIVPVNVLFFFMARLEIGPTGQFWFFWPLGVSGLVVIFQYFRTFVLKGRNLQSLVESTIHDMAVQESRKKKYRDFL